MHPLIGSNLWMWVHPNFLQFVLKSSEKCSFFFILRVLELVSLPKNTWILYLTNQPVDWIAPWLWNPEDQCHTQKVSPIIPVLGWTHSIPHIDTYFFKIVLYWWGGHCCPMHCDLFKINCAPPNLGITRTWICRLNFAQRTIFSGLRFFNEPEISDSGSPA